MKTIFEHTQSNVLVIPQALFAFKDIKVLKHHKNSAIFYKTLVKDLKDIEFYTNTPCFIYICSGKEVLTNSDNTPMVLNAGSGVFLAQGQQLHSNFVKEASSLKAYLVFFDDDVISDYLSRVKHVGPKVESLESICVSETSNELSTFFDTLLLDIHTPDYLHIKLQELLHLIAYVTDESAFNGFLAAQTRFSPKKNLVRLLESVDVMQLTVNDLAHLSGRSLSTFTRDFKATYSITPKKWLTDKRLCKAKTLLVNAEFSVTEVAVSVGYDNVSAFIKAFKTKYGVTPKQINCGE